MAKSNRYKTFLAQNTSKSRRDRKQSLNIVSTTNNSNLKKSSLSRGRHIKTISKVRRIVLKQFHNQKRIGLPMIMNESVRNIDEAPTYLQALYELSVLREFLENGYPKSIIVKDEQLINSFITLTSEVARKNRIKELETIGYGAVLSF